MSEEGKVLKCPITWRTLTIYSAVFLLMLVMIYGYFAWTGTSFIWVSDGFTQHYQLFYDYVDKLQGLFRGEGFPLWNWSIGMGADTITSYGYYVIGDPFVYLGVLFPAASRELAYHLLIFLRMWCIGGSFLLYARKMNFSHMPGLLGAVMYAFSHYVIYNVTRHPFFILPMIWYPLLCLGVEKLFRKESGLLFIGMTALSAAANFYFFYKLTLLALLYGIVRYGSLYGFRKWKPALQTFLHCLICYAIGVLLSAVIFLPMVGGFLSSSRSPEGAPINLLYYPLQYYFLLLVNFLTPGTYLWTVGGFSVFALLAILFIWRRRKNYSFITAALVVLGVLVLFPFFGSFMNGFAGPYNRFTFAVPFYLAAASALLLEKREQLERIDFRRMGYVLLFFTAFYLIPMYLQQEFFFYLIPLLIGWGMWGVLVWEQSKAGSPVRMKNISWLLVGLVALNMSGNAMAFYYPFGKNAMSETLAYGESEENYAELFGGAEKLLPDEELYRAGVTSKDNHVRNQFIYLDLMGLNSYLSITDGDIAQFAYALETGAFQVIQPLRNGFDDRRIANHFLGVRYILTEEENEAYLPYGYNVIHQTGEDTSFIVAETQNAYPFAYVENAWLPYTDFSALNPVEKEAFLAEGAVLEEEVPGLQRFGGELPVEKVPVDISFSEPTVVQQEEDVFAVTENNGQLNLTVEDPGQLAEKDVFVHLQGLDYRPFETSTLFPQNTGYRARVLFDGREKSVLQSNRFSFSSYFYRKNMLFHMGYTENGANSFTLQLDNAGMYRIEDIEVYALRADEAEDRRTAAEKWENAMDITVFESERIEGVVNQTDSGLLVTTIPYTTGWSATVNGEEVEIVKANIGFSAVPLGAGESEVVLTYRTPLFSAGAVLSLAGVILTAAYGYLFHNSKKRKL